jgi:PAS domain S-box-containing protein
MRRQLTPTLGVLARIVVLAGAYFLTGKLGLGFAQPVAGPTLIWPPSGIAVAALTLGGLRLWPGVWLGAFALNLGIQSTTAAAFAIASGATAAAAAAVALFSRWQVDPAFGRPRDLLGFAAGGLMAEPIVAASAGALSLIATGASSWQQAPSVWYVWALGDAAGVLLVTPALLSWSRFDAAWLKSRRLREAGLLAAGLAGTALLVWGLLGAATHHAPLAFLTFPFLVWAAVGFGVTGASSATLLLSAIAVWGTWSGTGPFAGGDPGQSALLLWTFLGVAAATSLAIAVHVERFRVSAARDKVDERLKLALEGAEDGIWDWDLTTRKMVFNERWAAMLGYLAGEIEPTWESWIQLVHPGDAAGVTKALEAHLEGKIPVYQAEHRIRDAEGQWRWILARGKVVRRDEHGRPLRMSGTHKDITERKLAREAQVRNEALIRAILETAPDGIITFNRQGKIESFNVAAERIFGYSAAEALGRDIRLLLPRAEGQEADFLDDFLRERRERVLGRTREAYGKRRDGVTFPLELSLGSVQLREDQSLYTSIVRDISVRKEAEENLKLFRAMVENTSEGVQLTRIRDEVIVYANPALEKMFGYDPGDLMGESVTRIYAADEKGTGEFLGRMSHQLAKDGMWRGEVRARRKDGAVFWCRIRISPFDHPRFGRVWVSVHEDITEQVRVEEERRWLEEQLRQAHQLESIGQLAGGVAHEFNNLLVVIGGHLGFALEDLEEGSSIRADLEQAQSAADRAAGLTHQLLAFSRRQVLQPVDVDLNAVARDLMPMLKTAVSENIELEVEPGADLGTVHVDVRQVEQVLLNLCVNARDAMPEGGRIRIRTKNVDLGGAFCRRQPWARPGSYVLLSVEDTGEGMEPSLRERIFEPFFTTKGEGAGTGLGLAMVHGVVQQHQALLDVASAPGKGSTFTIYWPRVDREAAARPEEAEDLGRLTGAGTLILAEDDDIVRNVAQRILEEGGYTVLAAKDGEEALRLFEEKNGEVDLVILDLIMPVMGGMAARESILRLDPHARILLSSGYSAGPMHQGPGGVEIPLVVKPFDRKSLLLRVREALVPSGEPV